MELLEFQENKQGIKPKNYENPLQISNNKKLITKDKWRKRVTISWLAQENGHGRSERDHICHLHKLSLDNPPHYSASDPPSFTLWTANWVLGFERRPRTERKQSPLLPLSLSLSLFLSLCEGKYDLSSRTATYNARRLFLLANRDFEFY